MPAPSLQDLIDGVCGDVPGDDALALLAQASKTVAELEQLGDALLGHFVEQCRREGRSWSEISTALGVSKQAAHKRFSFNAEGPPAFDRFTPRARAVLADAAEQARRLGDGAVGPEHLLLALFEPADSAAARILSGLHIVRAVAEEQIRALTPPGPAVPGDVRPYTPEAADLLRGSVEEALRLGHNYVGTEHLLLALARHPESVASRVLISLGGSHDIVKDRVAGLLATVGDR